MNEVGDAEGSCCDVAGEPLKIFAAGEGNAIFVGDLEAEEVFKDVLGVAEICCFAGKGECV